MLKKQIVKHPGLYIFRMAIFVVAICFYGMKPVTNLGYVEMDFKNYVGENPLVLDSVHYKNELEQDFTVTKFKYYVGNFKLYTKEGLKYERDAYFLVNAEELKSMRFALTEIPDGDYTSVSFTLGVDSIDNCSGAQTGALDPVNAMFWTWNTGYVFVKMEGKAATSKSPGNFFEYHIGGYKEPVNCIRHITLDLKNNPLKIRFEQSSVLEIKTDALEMLKTPNTIDFSKLSSVTDMNHAVEFADNYKDMFSVLKVVNE